MITLYRPVLITSSEQAEALPEGAVFWTQRPHGFRYDYGTVGKHGVTLASDWADETDTLHALVPIEVEVEHLRTHAGATKTLYVTDWTQEEA